MEPSLNDNLVFKVQSLEKKLNQITKGSSFMYLTGKRQHYESIKNLLELAKNIKHELHYSLKYNPENRKLLKTYNKTCIMESEIYNLVNSIQPCQNFIREPIVSRSKDSYGFVREVPNKGSCDCSVDFPKWYYRERASFSPRKPQKKLSLDECFEIISEPEYIVESETTNDSLDASTNYSQPSESSSSTMTIEHIKKPFYIRKSKSLYQDQPSTRRIKQKSRERIPVHIRNSGRKRDKRNTHKPILKKSSLKFGINKSDSNKVNVYTNNDLQTHETEVFLIKKKKKPSKGREQFRKNPRSGRYEISRLRKIMSKSRDLKRNKPSNIRKSLTPEYRVQNYNATKLRGKSNNKESDPSLESNSQRYNEDSLHGEGKRKKKPLEKKMFVFEKSYESRKSRNSRPKVAVARSFDKNDNPFYDDKKIFYLQDDNFIMFPKHKKLSRKDSAFSRNHINSEPYSKDDKETQNTNYIKPIKLSNDHNNSYSSYKNLALNQISFVKENPTHRLNKSGSDHTPHSKTYESVQVNSADTRINKYNLNSYERCGDWNSNKYKIYEKCYEGQNIILRQKQSFESKAMETLNRDNNFHDNNPLEVGRIAKLPTVYLATVPATSLTNVQDEESPNYVNIINLDHSTSPSLQTNLLEKTRTTKNNQMHTLNRSGSKIFPVKTTSKDTKNSRTDTIVTVPPLQNTKTPLRNLYPAEGKPLLGNDQQTDSSRSVVSNQSSTGKKSKKWLPRSLSKLSIISKKSTKAKGNKDDNNSNRREASKNDVSEITKQGSKERKPPSEKVSKAKSWTSLKRTMSGVGGFKKRDTTKKTEKHEDPKNFANDTKLRKQPSLLKRIFSREKQSKTLVSDDTAAEVNSTGAIGASGYEGDKTSSSSILNRSPKESIKLNGYQVASKVNKNKGLNMKKPVLSSSTANNKKPNLKYNPNAFNYSLHYTKENHKCTGMDLVPSIAGLVDNRLQTVLKTCGSKNVWSMCETVLSEHKLSDFDKHNCYFEFFVKPNRCQGCLVHKKKASKVCQKRGENNTLNSQRLNSAVCNHLNNGNLRNNTVSQFKKTPVSSSDHFMSDSSDVCDWKSIANEIKECK